MDIVAPVVAAAVVLLYCWQDGIHRCQDGDRYTSGKPQPTPFNRRHCGWPPRVLMLVTWASFVVLASTLGGWKAALLFMTLPGVWFCSVHPTTVDGPAMLLSWLAGLAWTHGHPGMALLLSAGGGFLHERSPVFAALYAWHPLLLLGAVVPVLRGWFRPAAAPNFSSRDLADRLVGHGTFGAISAHKPYVELLSDVGLVWSLRGIPLMAGYLGAEPRAWVALAVAYLSRLAGTDTARFLMWAAPPLIVGLNDAPLWMVALHVVTFRRVAQ